MKHALVFLVIFSAIFFTVGCLKDTMDNQIVKSIDNPTHYMDTESWSNIEIGTRNGYSPFHSPFTLVDYDIFAPQTLYIQNHYKIDSVRYDRISTDRNSYLGVIFYPYKVTYHFKDSTSLTYNRLVPSYIGAKETRLPDNNYAQLNVANPENQIIIAKTKRYDKPYNPYCGKDVWRWWYNVTKSSGTTNIQLDAGKCNGALLYELYY